MASLLPCTKTLPMTIEGLNRSRFAPCRDNATNRLHKALLQLLDGTVLLMDETVMATGQLMEQGVQNVQVRGWVRDFSAQGRASVSPRVGFSLGAACNTRTSGRVRDLQGHGALAAKLQRLSRSISSSFCG